MEDLRPSEIRFIQAGISCDFKDGRSVNEAAERLSSGHLQPSDFPTIKIIRLDSKYYSFDNRRLYAFRVAEYRNAITHIRVQIVSSSFLIRSRFDTENDGRVVFVRGDSSLPHCKTNWLVSRPKTPPPTRTILGEIQPSATQARYYYKEVIKPSPIEPVFADLNAIRMNRAIGLRDQHDIDEINRSRLGIRPSSTHTYKPPSSGFHTSVDNEPTCSRMYGENKDPGLQREKHQWDAKDDVNIPIEDDDDDEDIPYYGNRSSRSCPCAIM